MWFVCCLILKWSFILSKWREFVEKRELWSFGLCVVFILSEDSQGATQGVMLCYESLIYVYSHRQGAFFEPGSVASGGAKARCAKQILFKGKRSPVFKNSCVLTEGLQRHWNNASARHRRLQSLNKKIFLFIFLLLLERRIAEVTTKLFRSISKCFSNS